MLPSPVTPVGLLPVLPPQHRKGPVHYLRRPGFRAGLALVTSQSSSRARVQSGGCLLWEPHPLHQLGLSCPISDSSHQKRLLLWRRALATLSYRLFSGSHAPLSHPSEAGGGSVFADLGSPRKIIMTVQMYTTYEVYSLYSLLLSPHSMPVS